MVGRSLAGRAAGLGILLNAHAAVADPGDSGVAQQRPEPSSDSVVVEFQSAEGPLSVEAYAHAADGRGPSLGRCRTPCRLMLPKGEYSLDLFRPDTQAISRTEVSVTEASRIWVTPESTTGRTVGLGLVAGGVAAAAIGIALVASWHCDSDDSPGAQTHCSHDLLVPGIVGAFGGPLLAAVGLAVALDSGASADRQPLPRSNRDVGASPRASVSITGNGVGFRFAF